MAEHSPKFGLTRTGDGWVKKINGRTRWVVGKAKAPTGEAADEHYRQHFAALWDKAPPPPAAPSADGLTVAQLADLFVDRKSRAGLAVRTLDEYEAALADFLAAVGADTPATELTPAHFAKARAAWGERFGPDRLAKFVTMARSMFKWARRPPLRLPEPDYGDEFDLPSRKAFRLARKARREAAGGPLVFTADEVQRLLGTAPRNVKAMILLALNGGLGNTDVATLPRSVVDLESGWLDYARGKTGVPRRCPLWPETIVAVRAVVDYRPQHAKRPWADSPLLFRTRRQRGYVADSTSSGGKLLHKDRVAAEFNRVCERAGIDRRGRGFYGLRKTHRTLADEVGDQRAAALLMGHSVEDVSSLYVEHVSDDRLRAVINHVRSRLGFGGPPAGPKPGPGRPSAPAAGG